MVLLKFRNVLDIIRVVKIFVGMVVTDRGSFIMSAIREMVNFRDRLSELRSIILSGVSWFFGGVKRANELSERSVNVTGVFWGWIGDICTEIIKVFE